MHKSRLIKKINKKILLGVAHRGLHNKEITENSLGAFKNAIDHDFAFELDVHLTKDNELIVCHDSSLKRTTDKEGIIEELTVKEIKDNYHLLDGEEVPTFKEVLSLTNEIVPIVVELKVYNANYKPLAKKLIEELSIIKDHKNIMIISFDPRALMKMKKAKFAQSLLLASDEDPSWVKHLKRFFQSVDIDYRFFNIDGVFKRYSRHHFTNVWTIENKNDFELVLPFADTVTFQLMDYEFVREKLKEKNIKYFKNSTKR